jgi:hypothetical protein
VGVACGDENENGGRGREEQTELGRVEYKKEVGKSGALSWGRERLTTPVRLPTLPSSAGGDDGDADGIAVVHVGEGFGIWLA